MGIKIRLDASPETNEDELRKIVKDHYGTIDTLTAAGVEGEGPAIVADFPTTEDAQSCIDSFNHYADDGVTVEDLAVRF